MKIINTLILLFAFVGIVYAQQPSKDLDVFSFGRDLSIKLKKDFDGQLTETSFNDEDDIYFSRIEIPEYYHDTLKIEEKVSKVLYGFKTIEINRDTLIKDNLLVRNIYYKYGEAIHVSISYFTDMYDRVFILIFVKE